MMRPSPMITVSAVLSGEVVKILGMGDVPPELDCSMDSQQVTLLAVHPTAPHLRWGFRIPRAVIEEVAAGMLRIGLAEGGMN